MWEIVYFFHLHKHSATLANLHQITFCTVTYNELELFSTQQPALCLLQETNHQPAGTQPISKSGGTVALYVHKAEVKHMDCFLEQID